ncbi:MAG TPA: hypothetical protein VEL80_05530 [Burkholderiales bacterium]|nr:hypothetical protein [Burkholderiales bacterium]
MGQVTPAQAYANYASWYDQYIGQPPSWLNTYSADTWIRFTVVLIAIGCLIWFLWPLRKKQLVPKVRPLEPRQSTWKPGEGGLINLKFTNNPDFNVAEWVNHPTYFVWAAACLWKGVKPVPKIDENHPAYPALQFIKGALDTGLIESLTGAANMSARVRREELIKLASIRSERPQFLFSKGKSKTATEWSAPDRVESATSGMTSE